MFPIRNDLKQGDALSPLLFNFDLEYAIKRVQADQDGLQLNGTHQLLVYAGDVNMLRGGVHTIKKNAETLVVATREIGLEVNADKIKYTVLSRDQNAGRSHNKKTDNCSFERVEDFRYLGTTITNQNSIQEEIKSRSNLGNACYHSVHDLFSSRLLSKNTMIKKYRTIILPFVFCGCGTWSLTLGEKRRLRVFENRVLRRIYGPKRDEVTGEWRKLHNEELNNRTPHPTLFG